LFHPLLISQLQPHCHVVTRNQLVLSATINNPREVLLEAEELVNMVSFARPWVHPCTVQITLPSLVFAGFLLEESTGCHHLALCKVAGEAFARIIDVGIAKRPDHLVGQLRRGAFGTIFSPQNLVAYPHATAGVCSNECAYIASFLNVLKLN
jgi:hypothetical protein